MAYGLKACSCHPLSQQRGSPWLDAFGIFHYNSCLSLFIKTPGVIIKAPSMRYYYAIILMRLVPVYRNISGVYNTRVFFGVIIHEIHRAVQEFYDNSYALIRVWASMAFRSHFSISGHHTKHYFVHNIFTSFYCNKYLFIPTLRGNLKFHNYSIHAIPNTALLGVFHGEPPNSQQTLTYDNFLFLIDLLIQHSPD